MERSDVNELHYITAQANIASILQRGILSHDAAARLDHVSVASDEVQSRRASRRIPGGLRIHQYANLYFNARNAMLFRLLRDHDVAHRVPAVDLVVLRVGPAVLDIPEVVITDINAAADIEPRWHSVAEGLPRLDADELYAESWNHPEERQKRRHMQRMMAEVLVPHRVPQQNILAGYVVSEEAEANLAQVAPTLGVEVKPFMFFQGPES